MPRHFDIARDKILMPKIYNKFGYMANYYDISGDEQNIPILRRDEHWVIDMDLGFKIIKHSVYLEFDYNDFLFHNYMDSSSNASTLYLNYPDINVFSPYQIQKILRIWDGTRCLGQVLPA